MLSYTRWTILYIIIAILLAVIVFLHPMLFLWFLLAPIVVGIGSGIVHYSRLIRRIRNVTISDYDITTEILHSTDEEHYRAEAAGNWLRHRHTEQTNNYVIRFENGKVL